ncbi:MAG: LysE family translocator [Janthinobacterium lividum]
MRDPFLFALTALAILAMPGPTNSLIATAGAHAGFRRALRLVPAEAAGFVIAILTIELLLQPLLLQLPWLAPVLRLGVGIYLLVLAVGLWRNRTAALASGPLVGPGQVFVATLLNPKAIVFALGIVPFGAPALWLYLVGFVLLMSLVATVWIGIGATLGAAANRGGCSYLVPRLGATTLAAFAVILMIGPYLSAWRY